MSIITFLKDNPMAAAGMTAIIGGGTSTIIISWILNKFKWIPESIGKYLTSFFTTNILIKEQLVTQYDSNIVTGTEMFISSLNNKILNQNKYTKLKDIKQTIPGMYYIFDTFKQYKVIMTIRVSTIQNTSGNNHTSKTEVSVYSFSIMGSSKNRQIMVDHINKMIADNMVNKSEFDMTTKSVCIQVEGKNLNYGTTDIAIISRSKRFMNTVFLEPNIKNKLINHINTFKHNKDSYSELSIPYKTGIILHGPPGTGKTSLINAICSEYNFLMMKVSSNETVSDIHSMLLNYRQNRFMDHGQIHRAFGKVHSTVVVVVIEEIDRYIKSGTSKEGINSEASRTEQLMQLLDGLDSPENVIFIATTNNFDTLDKALIRPGRFDLCLEINRMSHSVAENMTQFMVNKSLKEFNPSYLEDEHVNSSALFGELLQEKMKLIIGGKE